MAGTNSREIVTLQAGNYSNFIGTHWWNLQESSFVYDEKISTDINHDVLFREGRTQKGQETYLPRVVVIDLKGSLDTLKQEGILYHNSQKSSTVLWDEQKVTIYKTEPSQKNEFLRDLEKEDILSSLVSESNLELQPEKDICQASYSKTQFDEPDCTSSRTKLYDLDRNVNSWSDFIGTHLHPRSIHLIEQFSHNNEVEPFEFFPLGQHVWADEKTSEGIEDKIRFFTEECNSLQGFHLLMDGQNGFAGLGTGIASLLQDEYGSKTIFSIPTFPVLESTSSPEKINQVHMKMFSAAYSLEKLAALSSIVVPISLSAALQFHTPSHKIYPYLTYNPQMAYHTSAILASALDTVTLLYRLKEKSVPLSDFANRLTYGGMKVAALSSSLPFPVNSDCLQSCLKFTDHRNVVQSLSFDCDFKQLPSLIQTIAVRGLGNIPFSSYSSPSTSRKGANNFETREELISHFLKFTSPSKFSVIKEISDACLTVAPFPNIFKPQVTRDGYMNQSETRGDSTGVSQAPMMSGIHCNSGMGTMISNVYDYLKNHNMKRFHGMFLHVLELDDMKEMLENLQTLSCNYSDVNMY